MQGRSGEGVDRRRPGLPGQALDELGEYAAVSDVPLIFEPLNRYETDLVNTVEAGVRCFGPDHEDVGCWPTCST